MYFRVLCFVLGLGLGLAQPLSAQGHGDQLTLTQGNAVHRYTLPGSLEVDMDSVMVLDRQTKGGISYILLDVTGPSRRNNPSAFCGAGQEQALVWLKLRDWKLYEVRPVTYASCLYNIEPVSRLWENNILTLKSHNFYASKQKVLSYARAKPEASVSVSEPPLKP